MQMKINSGVSSFMVRSILDEVPVMELPVVLHPSSSQGVTAVS